MSSEKWGPFCLGLNVLKLCKPTYDIEETPVVEYLSNINRLRAFLFVYTQATL